MTRPGEVHRSRQGDVKRTGRQWRSGPPPHVGWWNASPFQSVIHWRWWDGIQWSTCCSIHDRAERAAVSARTKEPAERQSCILWTDYWPERARVARFNPLTAGGGLTQCDMHEDESS